MTLTDISRLLKMAAVPRSKTVQAGYPDPFIDVHVPATHFLVVAEVVRGLALPTDGIRVSVLTTHDVREGEHLYIKVKGEIRTHWDVDTDASMSEQRRQRIKSARSRNAGVVVECASVRAL